MPDVEGEYQSAWSVVRAIDTTSDEMGTVESSLEMRAHYASALACVARCRSLLMAAVELDRTGRADVLGLPIRALLEVWYFGVIALFGTPGDLERLQEDRRRSKNRLAIAVGVDVEDGPDTRDFKVADRAKRADDLLADRGEMEGVATHLYKTFYAAESLVDAHATYQSLVRYVSIRDNGVIDVNLSPTTDTGYRIARLRMGVVLTALLAKWTWDEVGMDGSIFDPLVAAPVEDLVAED